MKDNIKRFLLKHDLYYKLRYSFLFRVYQYLFKPSDIRSASKEVQFYRSFLSPSNLIFDIGAYDGHKTEAFLHVAKKVVSCEPDQKNFTILKKRFRNRVKRVYLENKALAETEGERTYYIHHPASAFNTLSHDWKEKLESDNVEKWNEKIEFKDKVVIQTTTLDLLVKKYGRPDFIKIDVEGYEKNVLGGLSQPVSYLSFEALWPDGEDEIKLCIHRIHEICKNPEYNIAENEKLLLPAFINREKLFDWLNKTKIIHLEIVVKMS